MPEADFHIVGYEREDMPTGLPANVAVHGVLAREEYEPLLAVSDAAIGTLALNRKQMNEACPLKVREYLAYGLPVVIAYKDTDLVGLDDWFLLRLPNTESNVREGVGAIKGFVERVRGRRVPRELVADRIGVRAKEQRRLEFFERLAGQSRSSTDS